MDEGDLKREMERLAARLARVEQMLHIAQAPDAGPQAAAQPLEQLPAARSESAPPGPQGKRNLEPEQLDRVAAAVTPDFETWRRVVEPRVAAPGTAPPTAPPIIARGPQGEEKSGAFQRLREGWQDQPPQRPPAIDPSKPRAAPPVAPARVPAAAHPPVAPPTAMTTRPGAAPSPRPARPQQRASLEVVIGGKWMAWVGSISVVLAAAFAVVVGVQRGWWGSLSAELRCLLIGGFGTALIVGGEVALRRIGKAASVGLFGAGLGILYLDAFATFRGFSPPLLGRSCSWPSSRWAASQSPGIRAS
jgi:hypothetical protein